MSNFNLGDIVYHKATDKKCVINYMENDKIWVTTQDDQSKAYQECELISEKEWEDKNKISFA